jgi:hypothetical protein
MGSGWMVGCTRTRYFVTMSDTARASDDEDPARLLAVFDGGPRDGQEDVIEADTLQLRVSVGDGSHHLYERVPTERILPDGRRVFR